MWPDCVSNPGPLTYEPGVLPTALCGPAGHNICFYAEILKIIPKLSLLHLLIWSIAIFSILMANFLSEYLRKVMKLILTPRAPYKRGYRGLFKDNFSYFSMNTYVVTPHWNCLCEMVPNRGSKIWFKRIKWKITAK